ncbi:MAG TPA: non-canonical purine NTP pyrophosphatase [Candidatus Saccharimonadales bacterium]|nr:non-canonical purine NTP pyrophosphatase [Candidatus Saccharimonadales bacterium]
MKQLYFATTNHQKIQIARTVCQGTDITIQPVSLDIDEIQGEDADTIIRDKVRRAHELLNEPVLVSDDTWNIHALKGFPGPYMKSINHWFTPEDFIRLLHGFTDRRVTLHQYLAYTDGHLTKVFCNNLEGHMLTEARGTSQTSPNMTVTALDFDNGKSIAEVFAQGPTALEARYAKREHVWTTFIRWYQTLA